MPVGEPITMREAHVWLVRPEAITDPGLLESYHALMRPKEAEQQRRFVFARHRHQYLVTRALARACLSRYVADCAPADWTFRPNAYGRPEIAAPEIALPLRFNLSHTDGLIACLVALDREVGVDVEDTGRRCEMLDVAESVFSLAERRALRDPPEGLRQRFFAYWTLKESYIKARGMGLSLPLEQFSFRLRAGEPIRIDIDPALQDDPSSWQFALFAAAPGHRLAVGLRRGRDADLRIRIRHTTPLVPEDDRDIDLPGGVSYEPVP